MEEKITCTGDHSGHLCLLGAMMTSVQRLNEIKTLVRDPKYICRNCGRVAACAESLCNPEPLK